MAKTRKYDPIHAMELSRAQAIAAPPRPDKPWRLVYYVGKKRKEQCLTTRAAKAAVDLMKQKELRFCLVSRVDTYPPRSEPEDKTQLWCPYCRAWRYFAVPSMAIANGAYHQRRIRICFWCRISENDYWVRYHNLLLTKDLSGARRRRGGRRRMTRRR